MSERAREYFKFTKSDRPVKNFTIGKWLFKYQRANDFWAVITDKEIEYRFFFHFAKFRNMENQEAYSLVIGKTLLVWGRTA